MPALTRRQILLGAIGSAFVPPLAYVTSVTIGSYKEYSGLKFFTPKEAAILEAVGEAIIPSNNSLSLSVQDIELVKQTDELMSAVPTYNQSRIRLLLWTVEHVFPARCFYFRKFSKLSIDQRIEILKKLEKSDILATRAITRALKGLVQAVYYNSPEVAQKLGVNGRCLG